MNVLAFFYKYFVDLDCLATLIILKPLTERYVNNVSGCGPPFTQLKLAECPKPSGRLDFVKAYHHKVRCSNASLLANASLFFKNHQGPE